MSIYYFDLTCFSNIHPVNTWTNMIAPIAALNLNVLNCRASHIPGVFCDTSAKSTVSMVDPRSSSDVQSPTVNVILAKALHEKRISTSIFVVYTASLRIHHCSRSRPSNHSNHSSGKSLRMPHRAPK